MGELVPDGGEVHGGYIGRAGLLGDERITPGGRPKLGALVDHQPRRPVEQRRGRLEGRVEEALQLRVGIGARRAPAA